MFEAALARTPISGLRLAVAISLFLPLVVGCAARRPEIPIGPYLTVVTHNVHRDMPRPQRTLDVLAAIEADLLVLQETTPEWESPIQDHFADTHPHREYRHYRGGGGLTVLSRRPFHTVAYLMSPVDKHPAWVIDADTPVGRLRLLIVHLYPPLSEHDRFSLGAMRASARKRHAELLAYLHATRDRPPDLILGDFNENTRGKAMRRLDDDGYINALPRFAPLAHTWRLWLGPIPISNRIDHILHTPRLHCLNAYTLPGTASDHRPVVALLVAQESLAPSR